MKIITFYSLNLLLVSALLFSCGKTTKGKITNEWKVASYEVSEQSTFNDSQSFNTLSMTETSYATTNTFSSTGQPEMSYNRMGTVNLHELVIKKDGTWTWSMDFEFPISAAGSEDPYFIHSTRERTGTWSFIRKSKGDEFKKNERLLFNVLTDREIVDQTNLSTGESITNSTNNSFSIGDEIMVYTVVESTNKKLQIESETDISLTNTPGTISSKKITQKITLSEK